MNTTLVTAIITNINNNRNIETYIEYGRKLLENKIPKIIFIEQKTYDNYFINNIYENTKFIITKKENIYLYEYYNNITNFSLLNGNKEKDTIEYIFIQCHKTEWVKKAIELNYYNTTQFIWIDFGIYHMMNKDPNFNNNINELQNKIYDNVRIASCWNLKHNHNVDIYKNITWYFAGSIFGGNSKKLLIFSDLMKKKCINIINDKKYLMWEVNVWYLIYTEYPELFNSYISNHDTSIIINY